MATLKEIIEYSKSNPDTEYAKKAYEHIVSGAFDEQAKSESVDLSPFGRPTTGLRMGSDKKSLLENEAVTKGVGIARGAVKGAGETSVNVANLISSGLQKAGVPEGTFFTPTQEKVSKTLEKLEAKTPEEKVGKTIERVAEFMVPATKVSSLTKASPVITKLGGQIASDVGVSLAQEGEVNKDVARTAMVSAALSPLPFITKLFGKKSGIGSLSEKAAQNLEETNLRITPVGKQQLEKRGKEVVKYITNKKITGSPEVRFEKISKIYDGLEDTIQTALKTSKVSFTKDEIKNIAKALPEQYATEFDNPEVYNQLVKLSDDLVEYADNFKGTVPIEKINAFKRSYYKNAFNKAGDQVTNEARMAMGDALYEHVLKNIPAVKEINKEYAKAIMARKLIGKAIGRNELGLIGNIVSTAAGGALGTAVGGPVGAAAGAVVGPTIGKRIAGTAVRSNVGAKLQTLAEYLKTLQPDQAGNLIIPKSALEGIISEVGE